MKFYKSVNLNAQQPIYREMNYDNQETIFHNLEEIDSTSWKDEEITEEEAEQLESNNNIMTYTEAAKAYLKRKLQAFDEEEIKSSLSIHEILVNLENGSIQLENPSKENYYNFNDLMDLVNDLVNDL